MSILFGVLTGASVLLCIWQWICGARFPLHARVRESRAADPVTLLKPIKGWDAQTEQSVRSWLVQEYAGLIQVLFGVDEDDAEAQAGVRSLIAGIPGQSAKLIVCSRELGPHPKVAKLAQLYPHALHEIVVVSDADVWVPRDFLAQTAPLLDDPGTGMVNCFYCAPNTSTLAMRWIGIVINADFWSQVLQSNSIRPQDFALGAVMMTRRRELEAIGGFISFIDYLADDYQLGHRIWRLGRRIVLSPVVAECRLPPMSWLEAWRHQLRQSRNIRVCKPVPYFLSILSNVTFWCALWLFTSAGPATLAGVGFAQAIRIGTALHSEYRLCPSRAAVVCFWMVPIKDLIQFAVWAGAFLGNKVRWRGERFVLQPGGKLGRISAVPSTVSAPVQPMRCGPQSQSGGRQPDKHIL
jgi:ceramide glucosyltransferase